MDLLYFLQVRTKFIRDFYRDASFPFTERRRKIEAGEEPFEPPYGEYDEPPFLEEWMDAGESLDVLGQMCISMLASTLQLYLKEFINDLFARYDNASLAKAGIRQPVETEGAFKKGWINGYRAYFRDTLGVDWGNAPADLTLLEQIVLARNTVQHPDRLTSLRVRQSEHDAKRYPRGFFVDEDELKMFGEFPSLGDFFRPWRLDITEDKLWAAVEEVEKFCVWLEQERLLWPKQTDWGQ
jgi:hypothetical protein